MAATNTRQGISIKSETFSLPPAQFNVPVMHTSGTGLLAVWQMLHVLAQDTDSLTVGGEQGKGGGTKWVHFQRFVFLGYHC